MKKCAKCKVNEATSNSYCLGCKREYEREFYNKNKDHYKARKVNARIKRADNLKAYVHDLKNQTPCADCSKNYPYYVMHFDHKDPLTKKYNISELVNGLTTLETLLEEIAKCEIVCANCHAERTHRQGYGRKRAVITEIEDKSKNKPIQDQFGNIWPSQRAAAINLGLQQQKISLILQGKRKTHKGYTFSYVSQT